jgi:hypothetical protein
MLVSSEKINKIKEFHAIKCLDTLHFQDSSML